MKGKKAKKKRSNRYCNRKNYPFAVLENYKKLISACLEILDRISKNIVGLAYDTCGGYLFV
jgi:hypothetical protein